MLEIIYRIYEVKDKTKGKEEDIDDSCFDSYSFSSNEIITMDCLVCESRDQFKDIIRDTYGKDIKFASSKKIPSWHFVLYNNW